MYSLYMHLFGKNNNFTAQYTSGKQKHHHRQGGIGCGCQASQKISQTSLHLDHEVDACTIHN